ncbi:MAG TPA: LysR substrate-binding domain-containing protein [Rhodanobacteraceae bacterium]|jgi:LysR family glycine cleavage system transcriptional activator|nr:LysR substrate-binding domain-containing protein [Rhodanobacteraceae bacterium]
MSRSPLNALQTFVAAARARNLTRAAERLHLTVSALSHQIRLLEERIDCTLFVRGPRGLRLTAEGQRLLDNVAPHLEAIEDALKPLCARCDNALSLSAMPSMTTSWLLPRLPVFVSRHPEVELNLDSSIDLVDFADGRYDAALRYGVGDWPGLVVESLLEEWLTPVASPALLAGRRRPRLEDLGDLPLLCPEDPWQEWFDLHGGKPPRRYAASFSDSESRQRAAVEGLGVALGRTTMARPLIEAGQLVALFPQLMKAKRWHYLVYPERSRKHAGFMAFREWLLDEAARFRAAPATGFTASLARARNPRAASRRKRAS